MFGLLNRFLIGIEHDAHHARAENMAISLVREMVECENLQLVAELHSAVCHQ